MGMSLRFIAVLSVTGSLLAGWAQAQELTADRALVIANRSYRDAANVTGAQEALTAARTLQTAGFNVISASDLAVGDIRARLSDLVTRGTGQGRLVILLSGHFAHSGSQSWFVATDSRLPDLGAIDAYAVPVQTVLDIAALQSGGAVVLLGSEPRRLPLGIGLKPGLGTIAVPQGVTVISGDASRIAEFAATALPKRGQSLVALLSGQSDLEAEGFLSPLVPFRPADPGDPALVTPETNPEMIFWQSVEAQATPEAYEAYLKRFPNGRFAAAAKSEAARIRAEPGRQARMVEDALALSRDDRRSVQRALSLLEIDPRGIDGLFGAGSRSAIANWQKKNGFEPTTYLTRDQIARMSTQADARAAQREVEAKARKAEQDHADQLYWDQSGNKGDEPGLRAYLKRFPDGLFAEVAKERLVSIEAAAREQAAARDRAAWDIATGDNGVAAYETYLSAFPQGAFAAEAQSRRDTLRQEQAESASRSHLQEVEDQLALSPNALQLIESRLEQLDFRPGPADGNFDDQTRSAIRRFQAAQNLSVSGYLDQNTMVSLLADGVLKLGD